MSSKDYIIVNGVRYRREEAITVQGTAPNIQYANPNEVRPLGDMLGEAVNQGQARSLLSPMPQQFVQPGMPAPQACMACGHPFGEQGCPQHENAADYMYFAGFDQPGYFHQKCLKKLLGQRGEQLREQYGSPSVENR